jgi:hypothetical protein
MSKLLGKDKLQHRVLLECAPPQGSVPIHSSKAEFRGVQPMEGSFAPKGLKELICYRIHVAQSCATLT